MPAWSRKLFGKLLLLDGTYFYNRYYDLIVTPRRLAHLAQPLTQSDNLANSRAQGAEFSAQPASRPLGLRHRLVHAARDPHPLARWLDRLAPLPFTVGPAVDAPAREIPAAWSPLSRAARSPPTSPAISAARRSSRSRRSARATGLFWNPGFANFGVNLNYALAARRHGLRQPAQCAQPALRRDLRLPFAAPQLSWRG